MVLDPFIAALVLAAAFMHAGWNALVKGAGESRVVIFAVITLGGSVLSLPFIPFVSFPAPAAWPFLAASAVIHYLYYCFLLLSYREGDLSHVYPVARGVAPLLVAVGGYLFAGEELGSIALAGVAVTSLGIMSLALSGGRAGARNLRPLGFALATGVFIAGYTVVDGMGVRTAGDRIGYIVWLFVLEGIPFLVWALFWNARGMLAYLRARPWTALAGSGCHAGAYALVIFAMSLGAMAPISALRETSTILAAVIGALVFRESFGPRRILAAVVVTAGVILMNIGG